MTVICSIFPRRAGLRAVSSVSLRNMERRVNVPLLKVGVFLIQLPHYWAVIREHSPIPRTKGLAKPHLFITSAGGDEQIF